MIAGARGINYFNHSFGGAGHHAEPRPHLIRDCTRGPNAFNPSTPRSSRSPALNGPKLTSGFTANANVKAAAKWDGQNIYVLAGSAGNIGPFPGTILDPVRRQRDRDGIGESRTIPVTARSFTDTFADGNAIHITASTAARPAV